MRAYLLALLLLFFAATLCAQSDKPNPPSGDQAKAQAPAEKDHSDSGEKSPKALPNDKQQRQADPKNNVPLGEKIYEIGKDGVKRPIAIDTPVPLMPEQLRRAYKKDHGRGDRSEVTTWTVTFEGYVGKDGRFHDARVLRSISKEADQAALEAVKRWKFRPCTKDDQPVNCHMGAEVSFNLY